MKKSLFLFVFICCVIEFKAQDHFEFASDTIKYNFRSGSTFNDSVDFLFTSLTSLNPGGNLYHPFGWNQQNYFHFTKHLSDPFTPLRKFDKIYTNLPHLGFMYSFGSKGIQFTHVDFQHLITKKTLLNFNFNRNSLGEMLRNGTFKNTSINLSILHQSHKIINDFELNFQQSEISFNRGLLDTSLVNSFPYELQSVNSSNAKSIQKQVQLKNQLAYNFTKDSLKFIGVYYATELKIKNRVFEESDGLTSIYPIILIDSFYTRDQFQLAKINNSFGFFVKSKKVQSTVNLKHTYWDFQNLARHNDTNEISLNHNLLLNFSNFTLKNNFYFNVIGAKNEFQNDFSGIYNINKKNHLKFLYTFERKLPDVFQRQYFANNHGYKINNIALQSKQNIAIQYHYQSVFLLKINYLQLNKNYFYTNNQWRNDTLRSISLFSISSKLNLRYKAFGFQPYFSYQIMPTDFEYIPNFDLRLRMFVNKKVFKDKKLDLIFGIDLAAIASHKLLYQDPSLGIFTLNTNSNFGVSNPFIGLDVFAGMEINVFRFYIKVEKIDYLFSDRNQWVIAKTPIAPMYFRVGLTWDFFN